MAGILSGYRTYILAFVLILYAVAKYLVGDLTAEEALDKAWTGGIAAALRAGIARYEAKLAEVKAAVSEDSS